MIYIFNSLGQNILISKMNVYELTTKDHLSKSRSTIPTFNVKLSKPGMAELIRHSITRNKLDKTISASKNLAKLSIKTFNWHRKLLRVVSIILLGSKLTLHILTLVTVTHRYTEGDCV